MKGSFYHLVVHVINLIILGVIGLLAFFGVVNISPAQDPTSDIFAQDPTSNIFKFSLIGFLFVMWAVNYWIQYKMQKWILPIAGTVLYIAIALFLMGIFMPFLREIYY